ncbi:uncharacterized protein VICG_01250 [Vittaforma corneae ATCC 50505]|uniref:Secreted protein n=1 Tax=Vittaforma corneae (strain ATCC 50505) TaxID=993615 RepID=L2GLM4_VITCO|nr:uncharacterized protein VICG_01250 [Vittaforma corneae ATCC 50505]ELA41746.1 hypothetical protein VICG_01250 [Vittaforma corneae ATCC 50505]
MLILSLLSLISCKTSTKPSSNTSAVSAAPVASRPRSYVNLDGVKMVGSQPHAMVNHTAQPGGSFYLMKTRTPDDQYSWSPVIQYPSERTNMSNSMELVFPEGYDKDAHYCVMYRKDGQDIYSRPFALDQKSQAWVPSRTAEQDNSIAQKLHSAESDKNTTYTNKPVNKNEKGTKTTSGKKRKNTNSASGIFCSIFACMAIASAILL